MAAFTINALFGVNNGTLSMPSTTTADNNVAPTTPSTEQPGRSSQVLHLGLSSNDDQRQSSPHEARAEGSRTDETERMPEEEMEDDDEEEDDEEEDEEDRMSPSSSSAAMLGPVGGMIVDGSPLKLAAIGGGLAPGAGGGRLGGGNPLVLDQHPAVSGMVAPSQVQSYYDVILPHLQMATANPFLMAGLSSTSSSAARDDGGLPPQLLASGGGAFPNAMRQQQMWSQHWIELLQQAGHSRFFGGGMGGGGVGGYVDASGGAVGAGLFLQPFRKPKRIRTAFAPTQLLQLEHAFEGNHYVIGAERKQLAHRLNLTETQVKVWFQNRRTKQKRIKGEEDAKKNPKLVSQTQKLPKSTIDRPTTVAKLSADQHVS